MSNSLWPYGLSMEFSRVQYWSGYSFPSGDLPNLGIEPRSPALQAHSLPADPQGKRKNTGVGSLSLLQWIFPTQEWNQGLQHCRWIFLPTELSGKPDRAIHKKYNYFSIMHLEKTYFFLAKTKNQEPPLISQEKTVLKPIYFQPTRKKAHRKSSVYSRMNDNFLVPILRS